MTICILYGTNLKKLFIIIFFFKIFVPFWEFIRYNIIEGYVELFMILSNNVGNAEVHKKNIEMGPFTFSNVLVKDSSGTWGNNTATLHADLPYSITGTATNFTVFGP